MLTLDRIKAVVSKYGKEYGVKSAYLFGSYAKGNAEEGSDVDLLIEKGDLLLINNSPAFFMLSRMN